MFSALINDALEEHRNKAVEDDPKVGDIISYLEEKEDGYKICAKEIFVNCLLKKEIE